MPVSRPPSPLFLFRDVLNFLRSGDLPPRERVRSVYKEAQYYSIGPLLESLEELQPLKGEKVRQAFLGLMPYYKGNWRELQWHHVSGYVWYAVLGERVVSGVAANVFLHAWLQTG